MAGNQVGSGVSAAMTDVAEVTMANAPAAISMRVNFFILFLWRGSRPEIRSPVS
ncbi:hypothetical protein PUN4_500032 [Paraburkholderia unamae]|nr:hypothetical protein PUN4_500032 [Paraburkholderia unamae]